MGITRTASELEYILRRGVAVALGSVLGQTETRVVVRESPSRFSGDLTCRY
jgi:hypothetical protein